MVTMRLAVTNKVSLIAFVFFELFHTRQALRHILGEAVVHCIVGKEVRLEK